MDSRVIDDEGTDVTVEITGRHNLTPNPSANWPGKNGYVPVVPSDAEIESSVFEAEYVEEGEDEEKEISYVALLAASGMFALILQ